MTKRLNETQRALVAEYAWMPSAVARTLVRRLPPHVELPELESAGSVGLVEASMRFDSSKGTFKTFAWSRVRGEILDFLRTCDTLSRDMRQRQKQYSQANEDLQTITGYSPSPEQMAAHMGMTIDEFFEKQSTFRGATVSSFEDAIFKKYHRAPREEFIRDDKAVNPLDAAIQNQTKEKVQQALSQLSPRVQAVMHDYYFRKRDLKTIGRELGVTESRVCQIHGEAIKKLRIALTANDNDERAAA